MAAVTMEKRCVQGLYIGTNLSSFRLSGLLLGHSEVSFVERISFVERMSLIRRSIGIMKLIIVEWNKANSHRLRSR